MKNKSSFSLTAQKPGTIILYAMVLVVLVTFLEYLRGNDLELKTLALLFVLLLFTSFAVLWLIEAIRQGKQASKETSVKRKIFVSLDYVINVFAFAISIIIVAQIAIGISRYMGWF